MEVSEGDCEQQTEPGGHELFQRVVTLSGLPEPLAQVELHQILLNSGQCPSKLTLDQLRLALIAHLEALQADFEAQNLGDGLPLSE